VTINVLTPRKIQLDDGRYLFSAISHVRDRLILIGCHYFDRPIAYDRVGMRLTPSTKKLTDVKYFVRSDYEPCVIITADIGVDPIEIEFLYEGQTWKISPNQEEPPHSALSLMTLFKYEYQLLPEFIRYYAKLGVQTFYLYYNGRLDSIDWTFLRNAEMACDVRILLVEWDIAYWWNLSATVNKPVYDQWGYQHHAQTMAINHHVHSMRGCSSYTLFIDLDEYIFTPKLILDRCRNAKPLFIILQSWWAALPEAPPYESFSISSDREMLVAETGEGRWRVKSLVKPEAVDLMGIHIPHQHAKGDYRFIDGFFHFFRFAENDRATATDKKLIPWLKSEFVRRKFSDGADVEPPAGES
jgi:glycosyl transferase family 92